MPLFLTWYCHASQNSKMAAEVFPRMTSQLKNSRWRPDLLKACIYYHYLVITLVRVTYLFIRQWLLWAPCILFIFISIFLYHVNQCRVLKYSCSCCCCKHSLLFDRDRHYRMDNFLYSRQYFEKVVRWGSGSFEFYLLVCVILLECHSIRGHSRDVTQ